MFLLIFAEHSENYDDKIQPSAASQRVCTFGGQTTANRRPVTSTLCGISSLRRTSSYSATQQPDKRWSNPVANQTVSGTGSVTRRKLPSLLKSQQCEDLWTASKQKDLETSERLAKIKRFRTNLESKIEFLLFCLST